MPGAVHLLPCCFALKSRRHESYLRYVHEHGDEMTYGQLQLNGEDAVNPFTSRFDSEPSLLHEGLVHIRCRYNRKYWVPRHRGGGWWIVSDAHEPEEDLDSPNCTLIKPIHQSRVPKAGFPKLGLGATVDISAEFFGAYNWGETMEKKVSHEVEYEVAVPPKTKVTVSLIATRSAVDVPFDYRQRDVMSTDGEARDVPMTDGLYTGINSYNFKFHTTEEKLKPRLLAPTTPP